MENYYNILGVNKDASDDEIKKAYKKAALKYHPDRQGGKSEKEKLEAEKKFKDISEAYNTLSDKEKRNYYDRFGSIEGFGEGRFNGGFDMGDIFSNFFGRPTNRNRGPEPGETFQIHVPLSIEEIFNGCEKEIEVTVNVRDDSNIKVCNHCKGTGIITEIKQQGFITMQSSHKCPYCQGTGKLGTFKTETRKIKVKFNAGVHEGEYQTIRGMGSDAVDPAAPAGDIIIVPTYSINTSKYRINGNDVYELINVPYYDCILGATYDKKLPNGINIKLSIPAYSNDGKKIYLSGKGLNGGGYYFVINVKMPTNISDKESQLLKEIHEINKAGD